MSDSGPTVTNCLIAGNVAAATEGGGGGIKNSSSSVTLVNCTITENAAHQVSGYGGGIYCTNEGGTTITNSIVCGNRADTGHEINEYNCTLDITYSDVCQSVYEGEGNIDENPMFVAGDALFHLGVGSPCIDSGDEEGVECIPPGLDTTRNDMGAFGGPGACDWCLELDHDGDGYETAVCEGDDCNDLDPDVYPGALDPCDGVDNNCDGELGEEDNDGDNFMVCQGDCNDNDAEINPDAEEICDGVDNNCDLEEQEDEDADGDGYDPCNGDCDETDDEVNPGVEESQEAGNCEDGIDNDCDGKVDCGCFITIVM